MRFGVITIDGHPVGTIDIGEPTGLGKRGLIQFASYGGDEESAMMSHGYGEPGGYVGAADGGRGYLSPGSTSKATGLVKDLMQRYGLSQNRAIGLAANLAYESGDFTQYHEQGQDATGGVGWAQWTGVRRHEFEAWSAAHGLDPHSDEANLGFLHHELDETVGGRKTLAELQAGPDTIEAATAIAERDYEDAGIPAIGGRIGKARAIERAMQGGDAPSGMPIGATSSPEIMASLEDARRKGLITNEECVSLATAAVGIKLGDGQSGSNVHEWRRGEAAEGGDLRPGTPVATFLNRAGETTDRYAGGGAGTPGAGLDHAAVFESYVRDKSGKIIGMNVAEQYDGSGGAHQRAYMFGGGWGEHNASNYYAVKTDGGYLGGNRNPMARPAAQAVAEPTKPAAPTPKPAAAVPAAQDAPTDI
jgi:Phage tail lysozyme